MLHIPLASAMGAAATREAASKRMAARYFIVEDFERALKGLLEIVYGLGGFARDRD